MSEISFEDAIKRLNEITEDMQKGDLSLSESLKLYEEGNSLINSCRKQLENAEMKIKVLNGTTEK